MAYDNAFERGRHLMPQSRADAMVDKDREIERLRETLRLHAGDVMSLTNELDEWRDRALAAEEALALTPADGKTTDA